MTRRSSLSFLLLLVTACGGEAVVEGAGGAGGADAASTSTNTTATATSGNSTSSGQGGATQDILEQLEGIDGLTVAEQPSPPGFRYFELTYLQPADHDDPGGQTFEQRMYLLHKSLDQPVVIASTGYLVFDGSQLTEPAALLDSNQLWVEHRFFEPSRPNPADWHFLTIDQAARDHHRIITALKSIYPKPWISTGASKGGMTSVYHRRFFPDDVAGTVAYVAPQSYGDADPRYLSFLASVGSNPSCRQALEDAQVEVLTRRQVMVSRVLDQAASAGFSYELFGEDAALDYAVIEMPFYFWQYTGEWNCSAVPASNATDDELWFFLDATSAVAAYSDGYALTFEPYYFQAAVELGYPAYKDSHLAGLLSVSAGADVAKTFVFPEPSKDLTLNPQAMVDVANWLAQEGKAMMLVYGETDPYSAAAFDPQGNPEVTVYVAPAMNHGAGIVDLPSDKQQQAVSTLLSWVGIDAKVVNRSQLEATRSSRMVRKTALTSPL